MSTTEEDALQARLDAINAKIKEHTMPTADPPDPPAAAKPSTASSVTTTGAVSMGTAGAAAIVLWLASGGRAPMPADVAIAITGACAPVVHLIWSLIVKLAVRFGADPS